MEVAPTFEREYKNKDGQTWNLKTYLPLEDDPTMTLSNPASTKRKVYVDFPECYIEITSPSGSINAHLLSDEDEFKKFLYSWSDIWGTNFWKALMSNNLI